MNFPRALLAAAVVAATSCTVLLPLSSAQAATVKVDGGLCLISIGVQDMAAIRAELLQSDPLRLERIKAVIPGIDPELNLISLELRAQALERGTIKIEELSVAGQAAWSDFYLTGRQAGFAQNDLSALIISIAAPEYLAVQLDREFTPKLVGENSVSRVDAAEFVLQLEGYPAGLGVDLANSKYFNYAITTQVKNILAPGVSSFEVLVDGVTQPYDDCAAGRSENPDNPFNTGGGSSFGSS